MSRGGRGGGMGGPRIGGARLPFEIDQELEDFVVNGSGDEQKEAVNERQAFLFPAYGRGGVPRAPAVSDKERRRVNIRREIIAHFHAGPFFTGPPGSLKDVCAGTKRPAADFDAFNDQQTYAKRFERPTFRLRNLKNHRLADPYGLMPKDLWSELGIAEDPDDPRMQNKKVMVASKKRKLDKLAKFDDDDGEEDGAVKAAEEEDVVEEDDDPVEEQPQDDDFDEDDEDDANDYNAEQYFDGGEEDYDEGGGDDGYGDD